MNTAFELVSLWQAGPRVLRVAIGFDSLQKAERLKQMPLALDRVGGPPTPWVLRAGSDVVREIDEAWVSVFQLSPLILRDFSEPLALLATKSIYGHVAQAREAGTDQWVSTTIIWLASCVVPVDRTQPQGDFAGRQSTGAEPSH